MTNRQKLKGLLYKITTEQYGVFKRMYSPTNPNIAIEEVVEIVEHKKLSWAITQVENTILLNRKRAPAEADTIDF